MAVVVTDLRTILNEADAITGWTGTAATSAVVFVEGPNSVVSTLNIATGQVYFTAGASIDLSDTLVYVWSNNFAQQDVWDAANPPNALHLGDGTDRISFKIAGSDKKVFSHLLEQDWNWDCLVLDGSQAGAMNTAGLTVARAGSFANLNLATITQVGSDFTTLSKGLGGGINVAVDIIRYGNDGLQITGGTTSDRGKFLEIVVEDRSTATGKAHGIIRELAPGLYSCQGPLNFGTTGAATNSWFDESGRVLTFEDRNISNDKYYIRVHGHPSATNTFILTNCTITTAGPHVGLDFGSASGYNVDTLTLDRCNFVNLGERTITFSGGSDATGHSVTSCSFTGCGEITPRDVTFTNNTMADQRQNAQMAIGADGTANMSDLTFIGGGSGPDFGYGIEFTAAGTYTLDNFQFSGYGIDGSTEAAVWNTSGGLVTLNIVGGGNTPTVTNDGSSTTVINNAVTVAIQGLTEGTSVVFLANETAGTVTIGDVLGSGFADDDGEYSFSINYEGAFGTGLDVIVRARNQGIAVAALADDGGVFTNETTNANSSATSDMTLTPNTTQAANDAYYFAADEPFTRGPNGNVRLKLQVTTAHGAGNPTIVWEYWNGATWGSLTFTNSDPNSNFTATGTFIYEWNDPGNWATTTVNGLGPYYYIRARVSVAGTSTNGARARKVTMDTTRYLPFVQNNQITSAGLTVLAAWNEDTIAKFSPDD